MLAQVLVCLSLALIAQAQLYPQDVIYPPQPYSVGYSAPLEDGGSISKQEEGDAANRKVGSYSLSTPEGAVRTVRYVADENGFQATIETNEPGTLTSAPAGVQIISTAQGPAAGAPYYG